MLKCERCATKRLSNLSYDRVCNSLRSFRAGWKMWCRVLDGPQAGSNYSCVSTGLLLKRRLPGECCAEPAHVFLFCGLHRLSGRCSSASCVTSTLRCQLAIRKSIFDFCKSIQNHPHPRRDASIISPIPSPEGSGSWRFWVLKVLVPEGSGSWRFWLVLMWSCTETHPAAAAAQRISLSGEGN